MGYYVSNMFGIRTGGVFSGSTDMDDLKNKIAEIVIAMRSEAASSPTLQEPALGNDVGDVSHCMSQELEAGKGNYVVIAGVFNYWVYEHSSEFAKRLSTLGCEVMHMCWDEERNEVQCQVWLAGEPLMEVHENPIGRILRRVA